MGQEKEQKADGLGEEGPSGGPGSARDRLCVLGQVTWE